MNRICVTSKDKTPIRTRKGEGESKGSNGTPHKTEPGNRQGKRALPETHEGASAIRVARGRTERKAESPEMVREAPMEENPS